MPGGLTERGQDACWPEDLAAEGGQEEEAAHPRAVRVLQRVQHRHVALRPHLVREEYSTWKCSKWGKDRNKHYRRLCLGTRARNQYLQIPANCWPIYPSWTHAMAPCSPSIRLRAYPKGAWHHTRPSLKTISAVPLMYPPPTQVAVIVKMPTNMPMLRPASIVSSCTIASIMNQADSGVWSYVGNVGINQTETLILKSNSENHNWICFSRKKLLVHE